MKSPRLSITTSKTSYNHLVSVVIKVSMTRSPSRRNIAPSPSSGWWITSKKKSGSDSRRSKPRERSMRSGTSVVGKTSGLSSTRANRKKSTNQYSINTSSNQTKGTNTPLPPNNISKHATATTNQDCHLCDETGRALRGALRAVVALTDWWPVLAKWRSNRAGSDWTATLVMSWSSNNPSGKPCLSLRIWAVRRA